MPTRRVDLLVVGGGPAGLAAAARASELGVRRVALVDERRWLGGILPQCIHPGFGLHRYGRDMTGCELAEKLIDRVSSLDVDVYTEAHTVRMGYESYLSKTAEVLTPRGAFRFRAKTVVYAAGARERTCFEAGIVGSRPAGVYTAGEVQEMMDVWGILPGREVVVAGSGDVGLIVARRLTLEGVKVKAVVELMPYPGGLLRNVVQCLEDYQIPLLLSHVVLAVEGSKRVESVLVAEVDENLRAREETVKRIPCDLLVIAVGLIPRVELLAGAGAVIDPKTGGPVVNEFLETSLPGVFAAGNALVINDLVEHAMEQGELAAESAYRFIEDGGFKSASWKRVRVGDGLRFVVPQLLAGFRDVKLYLRASSPSENARLLIPELGKSVRLRSVRPAEMITLTLKAEDVLKAERLTVKLV